MYRTEYLVHAHTSPRAAGACARGADAGAHGLLAYVTSRRDHRPVLNIDDVVYALLRFRVNGGDWLDALDAAIPARKRGLGSRSTSNGSGKDSRKDGSNDSGSGSGGDSRSGSEEDA